MSFKALTGVPGIFIISSTVIEEAVTGKVKILTTQMQTQEILNRPPEKRSFCTALAHPCLSSVSGSGRQLLPKG